MKIKALINLLICIQQLMDPIITIVRKVGKKKGTDT